LDSFLVNKVVGAVLATALIILAIHNLGNILVHPDALENPAFMVEGAEADTDAVTDMAEAVAAVPDGPDMATLLAQFATTDTKKSVKKCAACHDFAKSGKNKIGPALWGTVGAAKASRPGFSYSAAMASAGGDWSYAELDAFLTKPKKYIPGTKMSFAGMKKATDRAKAIIFLRGLSDNPIPLP